jgi:Protein of unknown function (DUF1592)/Protein of unknown function (DUF1588)/Protein of unknown function (DUF1587)/Protein of unknown function (DUF1595)/Protein of unknown function (DUF1585)
VVCGFPMYSPNVVIACGGCEWSRAGARKGSLVSTTDRRRVLLRLAGRLAVGALGCATLLLALGCEGVVTSQGSHGGESSGSHGGGSSGSGSGGSAGASGGDVQSSNVLTSGHVAIHRLTNDEYSNTVQDLLFTTAHPTDDFPRSSIGESGFKNDSVALSVTQDWVTRAYGAAEALATGVIASKGTAGGAYERLATCASGSAGSVCASAILSAIASRAYRRPVLASSPELAQLMAVFSSQPTFDEGLHDALVAMLISPKFLFVSVEPPGAGTTAPFALDDYALASRLSYFLWQTMPDDALFAAAASQKLSTDDDLDAQVRRMLADPRSLRLGQTLAREWGGLGSLESSSVDGLDDTLRTAMIHETDLFMSDLITQDRSPLNLVGGGYSFVNKPLADLYGLPFPGSDPNSFVRVSLPDGRRMGVVLQAGLLTATAGAPDVTHPVRRGFWVTQRVMCAPPPPPPPNVPALDPNVGAMSIRDRLNQHVSAAACSGCHVAMDAVGLGLENYDAVGRWRDTYAGQTARIDASGQFPDGYAFAGPFDMFKRLASEAGVRSCLAKQLLGFALTRVMDGPSDQALADAIGAAQVTDSGTMSGVIAQIVRSPQFRQQVGENN